MITRVDPCKWCGNDDKDMQEKLEEDYEYKVFLCNSCSRTYAVSKRRPK